MAGEAVGKKLYDAATNGDVTTFTQVLQEDPHLLDEVSFARSRNLLHIATMCGQVGIVEEVLGMNSELARDVDSKKWSSLHIAAAQGHVEIAKKLLEKAPEMCLWLDDQGMNPVHIAAMKGHVEILKELLQQDFLPAMERLHRGQTVMHLCVKHRQLETLKVLVEKSGELVCAKDDDGETILHLAVRSNQLEMVRYVVQHNKMKKQTPNSIGNTPLDILRESSPHTTDYSDVERILMNFSKQSMLKALPKLTDTTMVVVVLIATMAFQAAVSPPGGVWQDDTSSHRAGEAVMASTHPKIYKHFVRANTTAFVSSLITIFLITTRQPSGRIYLLLIAVYATWVSLASIAVSYGASIMVITPNTKTQSLGHIIITVVAVSISIMGFIFVCNRIRQLYLSWKSQKRRQQDLTTDSRIQRVFYWIFQHLEGTQDLRVNYILRVNNIFRFGDILRTSEPSSRV